MLPAATQIAPASFNSDGSSFFRCCRSELPPMCFFAMKMFGTERWDVMSCRASWIAAPSSVIKYQFTALGYVHLFCFSTYRLGRAR